MVEILFCGGCAEGTGGQGKNGDRRDGPPRLDRRTVVKWARTLRELEGDNSIHL
jgi:hypothetical protein